MADVKTDDPIGVIVFEEPDVFEKVDYIYNTLKRLEPVLAQIEEAVPALIEQAAPMIEAVRTHPMMKMFGLRR